MGPNKTSFQKGHIPWHKNKRNVYSCDTLEKMSKAKKGKNLSPATEFKEGHTLGFQVGHKQYKHPNSMKTRFKKGEMSGKNNPHWKGGVTPQQLKARQSDKYKHWRRDVFVRDTFACQECGHRYIKIVAHHIKSFADYPDLRFDVNNGKTYCRACHAQIHRRKNEKKNTISNNI